MAVLLALCSAATYGVGDFFGGMATRRASAATVVLWSHVVGLILLATSAVVVGGVADASDLVAGVVGGLAGAAGVGLLYKALSIGTMSVVAPMTALLAASVPVLVGVADGERPAPSVVVGMVAALAAIVLVSAEGGGSWRSADARAGMLALGAGLGFGFFFVALSTTGDDSGLWPLVAARAASVAALGALALTGRIQHSISPVPPVRRNTAIAGALDATANLLYLLAIREGLLSVVTVLAALYPVTTVLLARVVLGERLRAIQQVGMALALPAAVLIAA